MNKPPPLWNEERAPNDTGCRAPPPAEGQEMGHMKCSSQALVLFEEAKGVWQEVRLALAA